MPSALVINDPIGHVLAWIPVALAIVAMVIAIVPASMALVQEARGYARASKRAATAPNGEPEESRRPKAEPVPASSL